MSSRLDDGAPRAFTVSYLVLESIGIVCYWLVLGAMPEFRAAFSLSNAPGAALWMIAPADAVLVAAAALAVLGLVKRSRWVRAVLWLHAGAAVYASAIAVAQMVAEPRLWPGAGLMMPVLVVPLAIAVASERGREVSAAPQWRCVFYTFVQVAFFWGFFLAVVPLLLARVEAWFGWRGEALQSGVTRWIGIGLFAAAGCVGLWSGATMASLGCGTPLPTSPPARLVISGPYRWLRNPMAMSGVLQGVGVGLWLQSWLVVVYALAGAIVWHVGPRPFEEQELLQKFGDQYANYQKRVRCWLPRRTPFSS